MTQFLLNDIIRHMVEQYKRITEVQVNPITGQKEIVVTTPLKEGEGNGSWMGVVGWIEDRESIVWIQGGAADLRFTKFGFTKEDILEDLQALANNGSTKNALPT